MASVLNLLLICATLVAASSAQQFDHQLLQQLLNPSPQACAQSMLLKRLGLCTPKGAEQEAEAEVEPEAEAELEQEQEVEPEAEAEMEQEVEAEAEVEQERPMGRRPFRGQYNLQCGVYHTPCSNGKLCIPNNWVCDGVDHCGDNSDESPPCPRPMRHRFQ